MSKPRPLLAGFLGLVVVLLSTLGVLAEDKKKVAEGEYRMELQAAGEFREPWKLYRLSAGGYEVEGHWRWSWKRPGVAGRDLKFRATLSPEMHPVRLEMDAVSPQAPSGRHMICEFLANKFVCAIKDEKVEVDVDMPYDLYLPQSWILGSIVRRASSDSSQATTVKLLFIDDDDPIDLTPFEAQVRYLKSETITVAGTQFAADKFVLQPHPFPAAWVWISKEGLVLRMESVAGPAQRNELVKYKKFADFGPPKP